MKYNIFSKRFLIFGTSTGLFCTVLSVALPTQAINLGTDYLRTPGGTSYFFRRSQNATPERIEFIGQPIDLLNLGNTDTIVERKSDVDLRRIGDSKTTDIEIVGLSLKSKNKVSLGNREFDVFATLNPRKASLGSMTITKTRDDGGTWSSRFELNAIALFVDDDGTIVRRKRFTKEFTAGLGEGFNWFHQPGEDDQLVTESTGWTFDPSVAWTDETTGRVIRPGRNFTVTRNPGRQTANCHALGAPCDQTEELKDFFLNGRALHDSGVGDTHTVVPAPEPTTILASIFVLFFGGILKRSFGKTIYVEKEKCSAHG